MPAAPRRIALFLITTLAVGGFGPFAAAPARSVPGVAPAAAPSAPAGEPQAMSEEAFTAALASEDLMVLEQACQDSARFDLTVRLRTLRDRLVAMRPAPQPFPVVLSNANALISCRAPEAALAVLDRYGPGPGAERQQWLTQQWRAANAGLNHRRAAEALRRLSSGNLAGLEATPLPVRLREDGTLDTRPALDLLAGHLETVGRNQEAAGVLLAGRLPGKPAAERLQQAAVLLGNLPLAERDRLLEAALDQAAAAGAWGLAAELLDLQRALQIQAGGDPARAEERRLRLSVRIDDAYAEWLLRRRDASQTDRVGELERQLRSPRAAGGHAPGQVEPTQPEPRSSEPAPGEPAPGEPAPGDSTLIPPAQ
jgi:hypothetical protein